MKSFQLKRKLWLQMCLCVQWGQRDGKGEEERDTHIPCWFTRCISCSLPSCILSFLYLDGLHVITTLFTLCHHIIACAGTIMQWFCNQFGYVGALHDTQEIL